MTISPVFGAEHRGILQPEKPAEDALRCDVCKSWFLPDADTFGCPVCAMMSSEVWENYQQNISDWEFGIVGALSEGTGRINRDD